MGHLQEIEQTLRELLGKKNEESLVAWVKERVRVERVKELLLNPNLRVSEIAFQTGFQSLTHFNRVLNLTGQSPTRFRERLLMA